MSWLRRHPSPAAVPCLQRQPTHRGTLPCSFHLCARQDGFRCDFTDSRLHRCETTWCPDHGKEWEEGFYCPRHVGVARALKYTSYTGHRPELSNRAPTLANFVGDALSDQIYTILARSIDDPKTQFVITDPISFGFVNEDRRHRWERVWKLAAHTGVLVRVSLTVDEEDDSRVALRISRKEVSGTVPSWVYHHMHGEVISEEQDETERSLYFSILLAQIASVVAAERAQDSKFYFAVQSANTPALAASARPR